jgi:hypothetical protein
VFPDEASGVEYLGLCIHVLAHLLLDCMMRTAVMCDAYLVLKHSPEIEEIKFNDYCGNDERAVTNQALGTIVVPAGMTKSL